MSKAPPKKLTSTCPSDKDDKAKSLKKKIDEFINNPASCKNTVRKNYEALMTSKNKSDLKYAFTAAKCTCKDVLETGTDNQKKTLISTILSLYTGETSLNPKYAACLIDGVNRIFNTPKILEQITCDFFEKPFFETPLGIAVIVGGSVVLLAIIILIVMNTSGGKRRRRK